MSIVVLEFKRVVTLVAVDHERLVAFKTLFFCMLMKVLGLL